LAHHVKSAAAIVAPIGHGNLKRNQKSHVVARAVLFCLNGSDTAILAAVRRTCNGKQRKYSQLSRTTWNKTESASEMVRSSFNLRVSGTCERHLC
jgi:hypothetical protein